MSALVAAMKRPVSRGILSLSSFAAVSRVRAAPLRLLIPKRSILNPHIGSMRLHTGSSDFTHKSMESLQNSIQARHSENSEEIQSILDIFREEKALQDQKEQHRSKENGVFLVVYCSLSLLLGVGIWAYREWESRVESRKYEKQREEEENRREDARKLREQEENRREDERRRKDEQRREDVHCYEAKQQLHECFEKGNLNEVRDCLKNAGYELRCVYVPEGCD